MLFKTQIYRDIISRVSLNPFLGQHLLLIQFASRFFLYGQILLFDFCYKVMKYKKMITIVRMYMKMITIAMTYMITIVRMYLSRNIYKNDHNSHNVYENDHNCHDAYENDQNS